MSDPHSRLLADAAPSDVSTRPFAHLTRTTAVPPDVYADLAATFPSLAKIAAGRAFGSNQALRTTAREVAADPETPPRWREFFGYHTSAAYWRDVVRLFAAHFRRAFPDLEARIDRPYEDWRVAPRGTDVPADVRLDCQFVVNTPVAAKSSVKTAHVDKYDKIFSALFYLPDSGEAGAGGDLELYAWRRAPRFVKHRVLERDVEHVKTVPYAPNTYVAFVNSEQAVHGVSPRGVTAVPRRYVNFIAEVPLKAFRPRQVGPMLRLVHKLASPAGGDEAY